MDFGRLLRTALVAASCGLSACGPGPETARNTSDIGGANPRSRTGETIILGKDDVIRVTELSPDQYRKQLTRLSALFAQATAPVVYFAEQETRLDNRARADLDRQAAWIVANPQVRVAVTGHADDTADAARNRALGIERARNVAAHLVRRGVDRERLLTIAGDGGAVRGGGESVARNRRAETRVVQLIELERNTGAATNDTASMSPGGPGAGSGAGPGSGSGGGGPGGGGDKDG